MDHSYLSKVGVSTAAMGGADKNRRKRVKRQVELGLIQLPSASKPAAWCCEKTQCAAFRYL